MSVSVNISDRNGRAFEYSIVNNIYDLFPEVILYENALLHQKRDKEKYVSCPKLLRDSFDSSSIKIANWLEDKLNDKSKIFYIDRLSDNEAKHGDVTDIRITQGNKIINLSVKSNHDAFKHQRPETVMNQLGFLVDSLEDKEYRRRLTKIKKSFLLKASELDSHATKFRELKDAQPDFIDRHLYEPIKQLIYSVYEKFGDIEHCANNLFNFLVGTRNYYKIVKMEDELKIYKYSSINNNITSLKPELDFRPNRILIEFSNNWRFNLRLHTASSRITKNISLKFDTQKDKNPVEYILL